MGIHQDLLCRQSAHLVFELPRRWWCSGQTTHRLVQYPGCWDERSHEGLTAFTITQFIVLLSHMAQLHRCIEHLFAAWCIYSSCWDVVAWIHIGLMAVVF